ncbi:hypothetical protein Tco_1539781 [Tanacetum coccineum]
MIWNRLDQKYEWGVETEEDFSDFEDNLVFATYLSLPGHYSSDFVVTMTWKANVVADVLKVGRTRRDPKCAASNGLWSIQSSIKENLLATQDEATKEENTPAKMLRDLDQQMEKKGDGGLYFMDMIWVPLIGDVRTTIMDEAHATTLFTRERIRCIMI